MKAVIFIHVLYLILMRTFTVKGVTKCESKVELRAVLLSCPPKDSGCDDDDPLSQAMKSEESQILQANSKNFENLKDEKEKGYPNAVKDCKRKLVITLKIKNSGKIPCDDEYIVIDHVFDPVTGGKGRLLSPVVLKLRQEQMIQLYGLQFQRVVNSDPFEEQKAADKTCSVDPENPTCGIAMYDGKPIPFSEGFCCSCDPHVNAKRQLSPVSHGDTFLYRDSKLISQGNSRFIRSEEKGDAIVNPELVRLKSAASEEPCSEKKGNSDCSGICDPLSWDKVPNFLLEHDRKIVCDRGDFMNELCKLKRDRNRSEDPDGAEGAEGEVDDVGGRNSMDREYARRGRMETNAGEMEEIVVEKPELDDVHPWEMSGVNNFGELPQGLKKGMAVEPTTPGGGLPEIYVHVKGSRGKRESRKENKKLCLEEKLERFASGKRHLTKRRKRLLELSRRRFRKAEEQCGNGQECQTMSTDYIQDDYVRSPPPKYFFSHDKYIIDPLESPDAGAANATCRTSEETYDVGESSKDKKYHHGTKNELYKGADEKAEKTLKAGYYPKQGRGQGKMKVKDRYLVGKIGGKKERVSHNEGGRIENSIGRGKESEESIRQTASFRGDKKFGLYRGLGEKDGEREVKEEERMMGEEFFRPQKARFHGKTIKGFLHKDNHEKKLTKPKIRNFFMARNHERQKMRSELMKGQKKVFEVDGREAFKGKNYKELLKAEANKDGEQKIDDRKMEENEQEQLDMKPMEESPESSDMYKIPDMSESPHSSENPEILLDSTDSSEKPDLFGMTTRKFDVDRLEYPMDDKVLKEEETEKVTNTYVQKPPQEQAPSVLSPDVDFNVEIIHNTFPDVAKHRHHSGPGDQHLRGRMRGPAEPLESKILDFYGRPGPLKTKLNLYYKPPERYYIIENDQFTPQDVYLIQGTKSPLAEGNNRHYYLKDGGSNGRAENSYSPAYHKKPTRRYFVPVVEYGDKEVGSRERQRQGLQAGRGKRRSEGVQRVEEVEEAVRGGRWGREKGRSKRSVSYSFEVAKGFSRSELESGRGREEDEEETIHELEGCVGREKVRKGLQSESWGRELGGWTFSGARHGNLSMEARMISNLEELERKFSYPVMGSRGTEKREKKMRRAADKERLAQSYLNAADYVLQEVGAFLKGKRQADDQDKIDNAENVDKVADKADKGDKPDKADKTDKADKADKVDKGEKGEKADKGDNSRGSQSCEKDTFAGEYTQDTAHCMRFGDLWYSLYTIKRPVVAQIVGIQLYDKRSQCDGTSQWRELTKGKMIRIGTFLPKAEDEVPSISMTFMGGKTKKIESAIDPDNYLLLIPSHVSDPSKVNSYPQLEGGPEEYLLVQSKDVSLGGECNMIGTSFEAFARQPERCSQRKGSCLKRQPVDLWREDMEARIRGKRGKYFVENFGSVPNSPIKTYTNLTGEFLALEYYGEYNSVIEIEVKADSNAIVRKGSNAQIPLVYIDSTYPKKTRIMLSVLNIGLTASTFRPRLGDCPPDLDPAWCPLEGPLVVIPPQQRHDFKLDLSGVLPSKQIHMTVQVLNQINKKIAQRKIEIKKGDRCVCAFHCKCNCVGNLVNGKTCRKLSMDDYRKAGYIGQYPFRGGAATSASESILGNIHIVFLTASYVLLFLGVLKGVLGIFFRRIGIAGIRVITGPWQLSHYYEYELQCCSVLYDDCGFPIHPTTCQPVQIVPLWLETIINFLFFFLYPLRGIWFLLMSLPCCKMFGVECDGCARHDEGTDSDNKCSRPLLSKRPQPTCVHYNLTTFNAKKSKQDEYLPYLPYKGDDDPLEEDDTEFVLQEMKRYRKK